MENYLNKIKWIKFSMENQNVNFYLFIPQSFVKMFYQLILDPLFRENKNKLICSKIKHRLRFN